jgi:hypothetical protein
MPKKLPHASDNPAAAAIRRAIGAGPTDPVAYSMRPRDRHPSWPAPAQAPAGFAEFAKLFEMSGEQLRALGCGCWDGGLYLFPVEWYDYIPTGFPIENLFGDVKKFEHGVTPRDPGFGLLSCGVRIGPALDGED